MRVVQPVSAIAVSAMRSPPERRRSARRVPPLALLGAALLAGQVPGAADAVGPVSSVTAPPGAVLITPGMSIQAVVDANPPGRTYVIAAGEYRAQQIVPKDGDAFIGAPGARLNGSRLLTGAVPANRNFVFEKQLVDPNHVRHGTCRAEYPRCDRPHALLVDNVPLRAVTKLADVAPGKWYFDYAARRIYLAEDPAGRTVELTYYPFAFGGSARNVRIENLIVEKYGSANQRGAINNQGDGTNWTIINNEVRWNYGYGINVSSSRAIGNYIHHNGQLGIGGGISSGILVEGNEIAFNVWNGVDCSWECGGAKWGAVSNLVVRANYVHDNAGVGLWTDEGCRNVLYEGNRIENNARAGISHEISFYAVIRNNTFRANGATTFEWGWEGQIQVQNSSSTEVVGNRLELDPVRGGNGIILIQQDRGSGYAVRDVYVHDNTVIMRGGEGAVAGWFADFDANRFPAANNRFDRNNYHIFSLAPDHKAWFVNTGVSFSGWQAAGEDKSGSATTDLP